MKRPLLVLLVGLVLGEITGYLFCQYGFLMPASLLVFALLDYKTSQKLKPFFILFLAFLCALSVGLVSWNTEQRKVEQAAWLVRHLAAQENEIRGLVVERKETASGYVTYTLKNPEIYQNSRKIILRGKIQLTGEMCQEHEFLPGDRISLSSTLECLKEVKNPGEYQLKNYCLSQGVFLTGFFEEAQLDHRSVFSLRRMTYETKTTMEHSFLTYLKPEDSAMICAMALGDKSYLSEEEKKLYEENGVAHLLAISGLHVSIVGGRIYRSLRKRGHSYGFSCVGGALLLFFYGCMTGMGTSVLRAFLMYLVYLFSQWAGDDYDLVSSMSLSGIFMLLEHPYRLLEGGFQISYSCVLAIGCVLPHFVDTNGKKIQNAIVSSAILYGATVPLILYHFYELTPYSILLNPMVLPWMSPLMFDALLGGIAGIPLAFHGYFSLFFTGDSPYLFVWKLLCLPAIGIIRGYHFILSLVRKLPGALLITGRPPLWVIIILYLAEAGTFYFFKKGFRKGILAIGLCLMILFAGTYHKKLRIVMLDVGQGECILIQLPHGKNILMDGGSISQKDLYKKVMEQAFKYYGITSFDYVFISHMDEDHVSGIIEMLEAGFPVKHLVTGNIKSNQDEGREQILELGQRQGADVLLLEKGDRIRFGSLELTCLHPVYKVYDNANEESLVLSLKWKGFQGLFTGDLGMEEEESLNPVPEKITLLKLAHHGSKYSTSDQFLEKVRPEYAILSAGAGNHYGHPHKELLSRVKKSGSIIYQTIEESAIVVESDGGETKVRYYCQIPFFKL